MRSFALNFAGVALAVVFLGCGSTKKAGDGGTTSSGGSMVASTGGAGAGGVGGVTSPGGAGGGGGATIKGGAGGAGGVTTSTGDAGPALGTGGSTDFENRYTTAFCQVFVRCGLSPSVAVCKADYIDTGAFNLTTLFQDIDSGRTIYDASKADPCFDAMANEPCMLSGASSGHELDAVCAGVLKGTVAAGGNCVADTECVAGVCHQPSCSASCCLGTCGQPFPIGATCDVSSDCVLEAKCVHDYLVSSSGTCQVGAAQGQPCSYDSDCQSGLNCDSTGTGTCVPYIKDGEPCSPDGLGCENLNSFCDLQSGKCRPRLAVGAACSVPAGADSRPGGGCVFYADCVGGICVALPGTGEACTVPDGGSSSLVCRAGTCTNGACQATVLDSPCTLAMATVPDAGSRD